MRPDQNRKYTTVAIYALIILLIGMTAVFLLWNLDHVSAFGAKLLNICYPIIYGALIAYLLNPVLKTFEKKVFRTKNNSEGLSRTAKRILSVSMTFFAFFIVLALFIWMLLPQLTESITDLGEKFPSYIAAVEELAHSIAENGGAISDVIESVLTTLNNFIDNSYDILKQYLPMLTEMLQSAALSALDVVLGLVFAIYFLFAKEHLAALTKKLLRAIFSEKIYLNILRIATLADNTFGKYFTGVIIDSALVGFICLLAMSLMKMPYAPLISVIIGCTNIIPFFGPFIGAIPSAIILFVANPIYAIWFGIMILVLQQIDGNIIAPRIQSNATGLDPVWVIVAITLMSGLLGFIGMVIGVPIFSVIYILIKEAAETRLSKKRLPQETVDYMSEMGRAYCEKPEKEQKPLKESFSALVQKIKQKKKK